MTENDASEALRRGLAEQDAREALAVLWDERHAGRAVKKARAYGRCEMFGRLVLFDAGPDVFTVWPGA